MKFFAIVVFVVQAVLIQNAYSQCLRGLSPLVSAPLAVSSPITTIAQPSVAASLADTLSLLTVSSLLSETLPLNPNVVAAVPVPVPVATGYPYSYGGCGCGYGYNNLGYSYIL
ncbi:uncharacterized protein LOC118279996 [Spodoptera frugiperda]|uniref:Uncharacterized protein LOC118279996 n=1 Tax=Spodoptera frugiperda TaxID=7108 RepID=A0A9R0E4S1_SPOFR|nr:uncharacterized protein LOC118279996 [Spodoptera frugiperda]